MKSFLLACALLASSAYGHIQMSNPYPIRSPLNKEATGEIDYSYTNPLSTDGSQYPCKGYANDPFHSVASYSPGQEYELQLEGSAVHGGGSCQIALSYDTGKTFTVIHSMLGGCPITKSYKFTIPADAPSGEALLSWSWFNKVGNREMYMNCAQVTIGGGARQDGFTPISRRDAFSSLPPIFIANVNGPGQCKTIEGEEVNFPLPGPSVEGSLSGQGYTCSGSAPFLGSSNSPNTGSSTSSSSSTPDEDYAPDYSSPSASSSALMYSPLTSSAAASPSSSSVASSSTVRGSSKAASSFGATVPTFRPEFPIPGPEDSPCVSGTVTCSEDGSSWWLCSQGVRVHMGNVAAGTRCTHGAMHRVP
ncbi:putative extracellular protein [Aspergillus lucknowensis]|uniref:Extracellular protein n=1 Tax=Aspergillus lucknowensis TaxID=176173 RepID=A0ABR4M0T6_9EURO